MRKNLTKTSNFLFLVLQYGFVTIFVSAFPLAPLFALINNICEMRLDAKKLLVYHRRPVFARVRSIGIWYRILDCISKLSVITNGFIIAFTSDFVPRLVYIMFYSKNKSLDGYVDFTLARFNTSEFKPGTSPNLFIMDGVNVTECRYQDFRVDYGHPEAYTRNAVFWNIMAARLIFVVIFENAVAIVMILVRWMIPDISGELRDQIRREAYITNEIIIRQEAQRASQNASGRSYIKNKSAWNRLMDNNFSGSQLDLFIHKEDETRAKKRKWKRNKTADSAEFIQSEVGASNNNKGEAKSEETIV
jgi:anoctamin-1